MKNNICVTEIEYQSSRIPNTFDGFRILHISDLHNRLFGSNQYKILERTEKIAPNIMVITGDLIDRNRTNINTAMAYVSRAAKIAPVYYVSGNHEKKSGYYVQLSKRLREAGVHILDNDFIDVSFMGSKLTLIGLKDPSFGTEEEFEENIEKLVKSVNADFKMMLAHRPRMQLYKNYDIDFCFAGHAHGGQFRFPIIGGLYAPEQGVLPKYTSGLHTECGTSMIVSRGLGNSVFPIRLFNPPELVVVTLKRM